jgi:predicted transcriptional regulator
LPDNADFEAVSEKLDFVRAVDEGLNRAKAGKIVAAEEVRRRLSKWLSE